VLSDDPTGLDLPWSAKLVEDLERDHGGMHDVTRVFLFCETSDEAEKEALSDLFETVVEQTDALSESRDFDFFKATEAVEISENIRSMVGLDSAMSGVPQKPVLVLMSACDSRDPCVAFLDETVPSQTVTALLASYRTGGA